MFLHESFGVREGELVTVEVGAVEGNFGEVEGYLNRERGRGAYGQMGYS